MKPPTEAQAVPQVVELLADLFARSPKTVRVRHAGAAEAYDYAIAVAGRRFIAQYKTNASAGSVAAAIDRLKRVGDTKPNGQNLLVIVPYMGEVGRRLCDSAGNSWLDLCGNAKITASGMRIWIEGRPNKFIDRGRPPNLFAAKSSRVARQLLLDPQRFQSQAQIAQQTGLGDGYVSKIVRRLEQEHYLVVDNAGAVRPRDPNVLLDAWHDAYDFNRHRIIKGHVPARSGDELLRQFVEAIDREKSQWAVTGLAAAWVYTHSAAFRLATVYLSAMPSRALLKRLEFSEEPKGANLWLVLPDDEGVFHGSRTVEAVPCAGPVQTYLDLKAQPERAKDAAAELRKRLLDWGRHAA